MPLEPYDWNVVVLGHWNPAILTPQGISERLFQLPTETEIGIEVPMDAIGPFRVSLGDLAVMVTEAQLMVETRETSCLPITSQTLTLPARWGWGRLSSLTRWDQTQTDRQRFAE